MSWGSTLQIIQDVISLMSMFERLPESFGMLPPQSISGLHSPVSEGALVLSYSYLSSTLHLGYVQCTKITVNGFATVNPYHELTKVQLKRILMITNHQRHCSPVSKFKGLVLSRKVLLVWLPGCKSGELDKTAYFYIL